MERAMINWTEADNRMQAHLTTIDRVNRQGWHQDADRSGDLLALGVGARLGRRVAGTVRVASALCRAAGRLLAVPTHRGAQSS
jgi:hypothetical protein